MQEDEALEPAISAAIVERLVGNHREFLGFLERRLGSRSEAEDILQEAFVRGYGRGRSLDARPSTGRHPIGMPNRAIA